MTGGIDDGGVVQADQARSRYQKSSDGYEGDTSATSWVQSPSDQDNGDEKTEIGCKTSPEKEARARGDRIDSSRFGGFRWRTGWFHSRTRSSLCPYESGQG